MLSDVEKEILDDLDNDYVKCLIQSLDDSVDLLETVVGELSNKIDKLEQRLDNV